MRLAIIGAGSVGGTLGQAWLKHGEDVVWGLRNANDPKYAALPKERVKPPAKAVEGADIVVIATPWSATEAAVKSLGSLAGKIAALADVGVTVLRRHRPKVFAHFATPKCPNDVSLVRRWTRPRSARHS
jgi:predicted dinucleotide-binding enzyme